MTVNILVNSWIGAVQKLESQGDNSLKKTPRKSRRKSVQIEEVLDLDCYRFTSSPSTGDLPLEPEAAIRRWLDAVRARGFN